MDVIQTAVALSQEWHRPFGPALAALARHVRRARRHARAGAGRRLSGRVVPLEASNGAAEMRLLLAPARCWPAPTTPDGSRSFRAGPLIPDYLRATAP